MKTKKYVRRGLTTIMGIILAISSASLAQATTKDDLSVYAYGPWEVMASPGVGPSFAPPTPQLQQLEGIGFHVGDNDQYTPDAHHPGEPTPEPSASGLVSWAAGMVQTCVGDECTTHGTILSGFSIDRMETESYDNEPAHAAAAAIGGSEDSGEITRLDYTVGAPVLSHPEPYFQGFTATDLTGFYDGGGYLSLWYYDEHGSGAHLPLFAGENVTGFSAGSWYHDEEYTEYENVNIGVSEGHAAYQITVEPWAVDIAVGTWGRDAGSDGASINKGGFFIYGEPSNAEALASLQAGNVTIDYTGATMLYHLPLTASVNFGEQTWSASFNNGVDSLGGGHGFNASGHMNQASLVADSITALDGTIDQANSVVQGAVFGNQGQVLGGGYEIVKTGGGSGDSAYTNDRQADVFLAEDNNILSANDF